MLYALVIMVSYQYFPNGPYEKKPIMTPARYSTQESCQQAADSVYANSNHEVTAMCLGVPKGWVL